MTMSDVVKSYLDRKGIPFRVSSHTRTNSSHQTASAAKINEDHLAKAVVLNNGWEYLMVVIPADRKVMLDSVSRAMGKDFEIAPEAKVHHLMEDCKPGAIPPIGHAYGLETLVDVHFDELTDVYFEAGDHEHLIHVDGLAFHAMLNDCRHGSFSAISR